ncbi:MAG: ImmA/IrrE family metallo-endopeptidase [Actinomycetota bacterium]
MTDIIRNLRDRVPIRPLSVIEAVRVAELQASRFLELAAITKPPVPESMISGLPRVQVERMAAAPMSGATQWSHGRWLIVVNGAEPKVRQRFSVAHEFKHVLDNPFIAKLYPSVPGQTAAERAEAVCDYFAGCLLMPRAWVKRLYCDEGVQDLRRLALRFDVSQMAMQVRLLQIGLVDPGPRCATRHRVDAGAVFEAAWLERSASMTKAAA